MAYSSGLALYAVFPDLYGINEYPSQIKYFKIDEGAVFSDTYNETLDTGTIRISNINDSDYDNIKDISVYDTALIYSSVDGVTFTLIKRMLVDTFENRRQRVTSVYYHTITIKLFSETKLLEKIILPNISITQRTQKSQRLSIAYYINQYVTEYSPYKRIKNGTGIYFSRAISVNQETLDRFENIEVKDLQMNSPTLRQAITELMIMEDCIPVLSNGVVSYLDLKKKGTDISTTPLSSDSSKAQISQIDNFIENQESSEYASELNITSKNVTNNEQENVDNLCNVCEMIGFRSDEDYVLTQPNNARIVTSYPIYNNPKVTLCFNSIYVDGTVNDVCYQEFDISDLITEKAFNNTKPLYYGTFTSDPIKTFSDLCSYKNTSLYYTRGGNSIEGFAQKISTNILGVILDQYQLEYMAKFIGYLFTSRPMLSQTDDSWTTGKYVGLNSDGSVKTYIDSMFFKVEYQTLSSIKTRAGKYLIPKHFIESIDNQQSSYSDSVRLGSYEYSKINRLGNKSKILNGRFYDLNDIPSLAETYEGAVVYQRSIKYEKHCFVADLFLTENYILRDYFTGVSSKIRSWAIAQNAEALERNDVIKTYAEFSYSRKTDLWQKSSEDFSKNRFNSEFLTTPFQHSSDIDTIQTSATQIYIYKDPTGIITGQIPYNSFYLLEENSVIFGNSLLFNCGFKDNSTVSRYIKYGNDSNLGGWGQQDYSYINSNGENYVTNVYFCGKIDPAVDNSVLGHKWPFNGQSTSNLTSITMYYFASATKEQSWKKPLLSTDSVSQYVYAHYAKHKDNREIIKLTSQIEFCSDANGIVFGKKFLERQKAVYSKREYTSASSSRELVSITSYETPTDFYSAVDPTANQGKYGLVGNNLILVSRLVGTNYTWIVDETCALSGLFSYQGKYYEFINGSFTQISLVSSFNIYVISDSNVFDATSGEPKIDSAWTKLKLDESVLAIDNPVNSDSTQTSSHIYLSNVSDAWHAVAICDSNDNVILAWNGSPTAGVWLNLKVIRDDYVYDGDGKVGSIVVS